MIIEFCKLQVCILLGIHASKVLHSFVVLRTVVEIGEVDVLLFPDMLA
jgi:hypothetical protein